MKSYKQFCNINENLGLGFEVEDTSDDVILNIDNITVKLEVYKSRGNYIIKLLPFYDYDRHYNPDWVVNHNWKKDISDIIVTSLKKFNVPIRRKKAVDGGVELSITVKDGLNLNMLALIHLKDKYNL